MTYVNPEKIAKIEITKDDINCKYWFIIYFTNGLGKTLGFQTKQECVELAENLGLILID